MRLLALSSVLALASAQSNFNFGDHAVDQCSNPIASITNSGRLDVFPAREADGSCQGDLCLGDCVTVIINGGSEGQSPPLNVIIGATLPDPGDCSAVADGRNDPPGWDFTHNGMCGKGEWGTGYWLNCFVHDVCVWARCTDDDSIPGGISIRGDEGGKADKYCGNSFIDAKTDYRKANLHIIGCGADSGCPDPMTCRLGKCDYPRPEGDYCDDDSDCEGYCSFFRCRSGNEGDVCEKDADCDGYCQLLKCYDGSEGDRCGKDADCQSGLTCYGVRGSTARCEKKKGEGAKCLRDSDCTGYCQMLRCWDGSKGDKCKNNSDCQGGNCRLLRCR